MLALSFIKGNSYVSRVSGAKWLRRLKHLDDGPAHFTQITFFSLFLLICFFSVFCFLFPFFFYLVFSPLVILKNVVQFFECNFFRI